MYTMSRCLHLRHLQRFSHLNQGRTFADDTSDKLKLYKALGVKSTATQSEIKQAYYDLTFRYHPDRNKGSETAAEKFRIVTEAYEILGDYDSRKIYDKGISPYSGLVKPKVRSVIEEKDVQYQTFYDSRSAHRSSYDSSNEEYIGKRRASSRSKTWEEQYEERFEATRTPGTKAVVFAILFFWVCTSRFDFIKDTFRVD